MGQPIGTYHKSGPYLISLRQVSGGYPYYSISIPRAIGELLEPKRLMYKPELTPEGILLRVVSTPEDTPTPEWAQ